MAEHKLEWLRKEIKGISINRQWRWVTNKWAVQMTDLMEDTIINSCKKDVLADVSGNMRESETMIKNIETNFELLVDGTFNAATIAKKYSEEKNRRRDPNFNCGDLLDGVREGGTTTSIGIGQLNILSKKGVTHQMLINWMDWAIPYPVVVSATAAHDGNAGGAMDVGGKGTGHNPPGVHCHFYFGDILPN